jgi:hypothetical protein
MEDFCYWSVGDGDYAYMMQALVHSFRSVGMKEEFIAFSDRSIEGATTHLVSPFEKLGNLFKFKFLKELKDLPFRYFVFLDSDNLFMRKPPDLFPLVADTPLHVFFEGNCSHPPTPLRRKNWWGCPLPIYVGLMRDCGVLNEHVYNVNAGFFIIKREAIDTVCTLAYDFWEYGMSHGYAFTEEPPLAYAAQMLCADPAQHLLTRHLDIWASDWAYYFANRLPKGNPWTLKDWLGFDEYLVNPAIVHLIKSKPLLVQLGKKNSSLVKF